MPYKWNCNVYQCVQMLNFTLKLVEIQILRIFVVYNIIIIFLKIRIGILKALIRN